VFPRRRLPPPPRAATRHRGVFARRSAPAAGAASAPARLDVGSTHFHQP